MGAKELVMRFVKDESGLETVEYAIILGLIVVAVIAAVMGIGTWVNLKFQNLNTELAKNP